MKPPLPSKFAALILPLFCGGLIIGLLSTLTVAAWPAISSQPMAMFDPLWSISPASQGVYYGYGGFLLASLFTSVLAVGTVLVLSWLGAMVLRRIAGGRWLGNVLIDVLHVLGAIPPVAIGGAVALWLLPALAQTAGYSGRCYLLGIVALVGIHWPRLTLAWLELLDSFSPALTANARALGASRWHILRWVKWPAMKHRVVELGLQTLVRCLGEAAGIFFVCGTSGQTVFQFDLLGNTDTMSTKLLSTDAAWFGPDRPALIMVTLALTLLCLAVSSLRGRISRGQPVLPTQPSPRRLHPAGFVAVVLLLLLLLCYLVPLLLAGHVAMEYSSAVSASTVTAATLKWLLLVLPSTLLAFPFALWTVRLQYSAQSVRWLQGCPPIVWAVAVGCVLPYGYRTVGLMLALTLIQGTWLTLKFADILKAGPVLPRRDLLSRTWPQLLGAVLMSVAMAVGELNILALQVDTQTTSTLLADLAFSTSAEQSRIAVFVLLGMSLALAMLSRLIYRVFRPHSDSA